VAHETPLVGRRRSHLGGIQDVRRGAGFGVLAARPVARFAGPALPATPLVSLDPLVSALAEWPEEVFVAALAGLRADVLGRGLLRCGRLKACPWTLAFD